jgi:hypothetical protein
MLQSYHEHGISTPECLLIEVNQPLLLHRGNAGFCRVARRNFTSARSQTRT